MQKNEIKKDDIENDLYLRKVALGEIKGSLTGYASIDKPWLKYYPEEKLQEKVSKDNIYNYLKKSIKNPNSIAINYFGNKITFKNLFKCIDTISKSFLEMGIKKGDIVTLLLANIPENVLCMYALNKIGAIPNMVDLRAKEDKLVHYINSTDSKMVITTSLFLQNLDEVADKIITDKIVVTSPFDSMPLPIRKTLKIIKRQYKPKNIKMMTWKKFESLGKKSALDYNYNSKDTYPACIVHTSGTTGNPKGVVLSNKTYNAMVIQYKDVIVDAKDGEKLLCQVPPFVAYSVIMSIHLPLCLGVTLEMLPTYEPEKFADNVYKHKTEHLVAGPADWNSFLTNDKVKKRNYNFVKTLGSGSDKINTETRHKIDKVLKETGCKYHIFEGYGMTEVGSAAVTNLPYHIVDDSVGVPLPKMSVMIYDNESEKELTYEKIGEVCLHGETMMNEYYKNPEATNDMMRLHSDGRYWIHTGDYGYMNSDGNLFLKGRIKRIIVLHDGYKVSPLDIEKVLMNLDIVSNCCVIGIRNVEKGYGALPIANVVLNSATIEDEQKIIDKLKKKCDEALSEVCRPKKIIVRKSLPMTNLGKVDYRALEEMCETEINGLKII